MRHPFLIAIGLVFVLFTPVYLAGSLFGWSPTVAGWWSLIVIGIATLVWSSLAARREDGRRSGRHARSRHPG
ncbi:MAG TPA: hypothetical protein VID51_00890 [Solirubrobacterales bacterium]|jgi:hypothetical protein